MQHVPFAKNSPAEHPPDTLYVRLLPGVDLDRQETDIDFLNYSENFSGGQSRVELGEFASQSDLLAVQERLKDLQSWGYFGLLHEVYRIAGLEFNAHVYVEENENGKKCVTSRELDSLSVRWEMQRIVLMAIDRNEADRRHARLLACVKQVSLFARRMFPFSDSGEVPQDLHLVDTDTTILVSVILLIEVLLSWIRRHYADLHLSIPSGPRFGSLNYLRRRLSAAGWCPSEIRSLELTSGYDVSHMLLASSLDRQMLNRVHRPHPRVSNACVCEISKDAEYNPPRSPVVHMQESCVCELLITKEDWIEVEKSVEKIVKKKEKGCYPLLTIAYNGVKQRLEVKVQSSKQDGQPIKYFAISHLWEDGLGVKDGHYLPPCKLHWLQERVNALDLLPSPGKFWLDTICIPRSDNDLRMQAIGAMIDVYREAAYVYVLDATVYSVDFFVEKPEASLMRVAFSRWMTRGWTFQEAGMATNLYVAFRDRDLTYGVLLNKVAEARFKRRQGAGDILQPYPYSLGAAKILFPQRSDAFTAFSISKLEEVLWYYKTWDKRSENSEVDELRGLYWSLSHRVVTVSSDEALIVALLLKRDVNELFSGVEKSQHMRALLSRFSKVPTELLFHQGPHYPGESVRWMPTSIFRQPENDPTKNQRALMTTSAVVTPKGLVATLNGCRVYLRHEGSDQDVNRTALFKVNDDECPYAGFMVFDTNIALSREPSRELALLYPPSRQKVSNSLTSYYSTLNTATIPMNDTISSVSGAHPTRASNTLATRHNSSSSPNPGGASLGFIYRAALVSITQRLGGMIYCRLESTVQVHVTGLGTGDVEYFPDQKWCIS